MTDTSRRTVLRAGAFGVLLAPLASVRTAFAAGTVNLYSRSRFRFLLKAKFALVSGTSTWAVTLVKVSDLAGAPKGDDGRYGLTFSSATPGPPQGSYSLNRNGFAATEFFVVPDATGRTYQAIVNRV